MRTMVVKGTGNVKERPDTVRISLDVSAIDKDYETAIRQEAEKIRSLVNAIVSAGLQEKDLKTSDYDVGAEYDWDERGKKRVFTGYKCSHECYFMFDYSSEQLQRILGALAACASEVEFNIQFTIKDKTAIKQRLLEDAVNNSKERALILAAAAGVKLGSIQNIDYNWGELNVYSETHFSRRHISIARYDAGDFLDEGFEPDDINVHDSVTMVWEIE